MIAERRPFTDMEREQTLALARLPFTPGSPYRGFVRMMAARAEGKTPDLTGATEGQFDQLKRLLWRARDKLPPHLRPANPYL